MPADSNTIDMKFFKRKKKAEAAQPAADAVVPESATPGAESPAPSADLAADNTVAQPADAAGAIPETVAAEAGLATAVPPAEQQAPQQVEADVPAPAADPGKPSDSVTVSAPVPVAAASPSEAPTQAAEPGSSALESVGQSSGQPDSAPEPTQGAVEAAAPPTATQPDNTSAAESEAAQAPTPAAKPAKEQARPGFFARLKRGLGRTSDNLVSGLGNLFLGRKEIDAELLEELESRLLMADVGVDATLEIIGKLTQRVSRKELTNPEALQNALKEELLALLKPSEQPLSVSGHKPYVILMVGVNGVGKTTTIGKMAKRFQAEGRSVMLAAGDTFRAAAVEQLQVWGERNNVPVVAQHTGADSASVVFDALQAAQARNIDVLIADTAGRLHNKDNLMEELKKVVRVMGKLDDSAPHEVMLVLDAGTGQNALAQADHFRQWVGVSGISLSKLDGTAKGGVIFAIAKKLGLPIRFIGIGEAAEDLRPFVAEDFIEALFAGDDAAA